MKPIMFIRSSINAVWVVKLALAAVLIALSSLSFSRAAAGAVEAGGSPYEVVQSVTDNLLVYLKQNEKRLQQDPRGYYSDIKSMLEPVIAFPYIARNVMSGWWNYASPEQKQLFVDVFTDSLLETYVKGMANYAHLKVDVLPPKEGEGVPDTGSVNVIQLVQNSQGDTKVVYSMRRNNAETNWRLVNVWLGSSNLGAALKSQFSGAVTANLPKLKEGETYSQEQVSAAISAAINNWGKA